LLISLSFPFKGFNPNSWVGKAFDHIFRQGR